VFVSCKRGFDVCVSALLLVLVAALSRGSVKGVLFLASDAGAVTLSGWVAVEGAQRFFKIPRVYYDSEHYPE
jgi:hypothetical protein